MAHQTKKVFCIVGTRPEVIKMAPVIRTLRATTELDVKVLVSGQHCEILTPLIDWFELAVDVDLRVTSEDRSLSALSARLMQILEQQLAAWRPDLVLAQGDTTTVMCAALSCFYLNIPFGHVEAGLRTFDVRNPFPEEFNRIAVTRLARLHFCPTERARANVLAEDIRGTTAHLIGNTVIDALQFTIAKLATQAPRNFDYDIILTAHRRENFGAPLAQICGALVELCREFPNLKVLYPVHLNPVVRSTAQRLLAGHPQITLTESLSYPEFIAAMLRAKLILTDSGGIQEEAPALAKPVLILRAVTERPESVEWGVATLIGTAQATIVAETRRLLLEPERYARMARGGSPYGDGHAAARIRDIVCQFLGDTSAVSLGISLRDPAPLVSI